MRHALLSLLLLAPSGFAQESQPSPAAAIEAAFRERLEMLQRDRGVSGACAAFTLPGRGDGTVAVGVDATQVPLTVTSKLMSGGLEAGCSRHH